MRNEWMILLTSKPARPSPHGSGFRDRPRVIVLQHRAGLAVPWVILMHDRALERYTMSVPIITNPRATTTMLPSRMNHPETSRSTIH